VVEGGGGYLIQKVRGLTFHSLVGSKHSIPSISSTLSFSRKINNNKGNYRQTAEISDLGDANKPNLKVEDMER
jgi:hypothetical protein